MSQDHTKTDAKTEVSADAKHDATKTRALLSWSSGKDSAWALHVLRSEPAFAQVEVVGLLTTINAARQRVAMHGVRCSLLREQAAAVGLEPWIVELPEPCSNSDYERIMAGVVAEARARGITAVAFGDLYLEDIRRYRERMLEGTGLTPLFPLWGRATDALAREMVAAGARAVITCVDPKQCSRDWLGRELDRELLDAASTGGPGARGVDPCGENGEFHTFAYDGPAFTRPVEFTRGEAVLRGGFAFLDLVPR